MERGCYWWESVRRVDEGGSRKWKEMKGGWIGWRSEGGLDLVSRMDRVLDSFKVKRWVGVVIA